MQFFASPHTSLRAVFMTTWLTLLVTSSACTYESSSLGGLLCEEEGRREGDKICQNGVWVVLDNMDLPVADLPGEDLPDLVADLPGDLGDDMPDQTCVSEDREAFCRRQNASCGSVIALDNCNMERTVDECGPCPGMGETCQDNKCIACVPELPAQLCARLGKDCEQINAVDNCGMMRQNIGCGTCSGADSCVDNECVCVPESDAVLCGRLGKSCGTLPPQFDNCGRERLNVRCGGCTQGTCQADNTCSVCQAETDDAFCSRTGAVCGSRSGMDNCGDPRTVDSCGGCSPGQNCTSNRCVCPVPACPGGAVCGTVSNACGQQSAPCGPGCSGAQTCNAVNACECPLPVCPATAQCGVATNACGSVRCGANNGDCAAGSTCMGNSCVCQPETREQFCARTNAECGSKTAADNCGTPRTVAECGVCADGETCSANQCECPTPTCGANDQCGSITNVCGNTVMCGDMGACSTAGLTCDPMARTCSNIVLTAPGPNDNDIFGWSLALRGDLLVVGRPDADVGGQVDKGSVEIYRRDVMTNQWSHVQTLSPNDNTNMGARGAAGDYFGTSVAFDGTTLVVGAPQYNFLDPGYTGKGYVYTYTVSGNTFAFQQRLAPAGGTNTSDDARYGWSVAVSGSRLAIGAPLDDDGGKQSAGAIFTFVLSGNTWGAAAKLRLDDSRGTDATFDATVAEDQFGYALAMDGDMMVVGAPFRDPASANDAGVAAIYQFSSGWRRRAVFDPADRVAGANLGFDVAVLGTRAAFGAPNGNGAQAGAGVVYVVDDLLGARGSSKLQHAMAALDDFAGRAVALGVDRLVSGATNRVANTFSGAGVAHLYSRGATTWTQQAQITAPAANAAVNDRFGRAVAIDGRRVAVAAPFAGANDTGVVFIYEYP